MLEDARQGSGWPLGTDSGRQSCRLIVDLVEPVSHRHRPPPVIGPIGRKGVAEAGIVCKATAIASAIENDADIHMTELPATPDEVTRST